MSYDEIDKCSSVKEVMDYLKYKESHPTASLKDYRLRRNILVEYDYPFNLFVSYSNPVFRFFFSLYLRIKKKDLILLTFHKDGRTTQKYISR